MLQRNDIVKFFELKNLKYDEVKIGIWHEYLRRFNYKGVLNALDSIVLDTSIINPSVGHVVDKMGISENELIEREWQECLESAKQGGTKKISARAAKALNSLGGMMWLRNSDPGKNEWHRKEFIDIYKITPSPEQLDFRCYGLELSPYLTDTLVLITD